MAVDGNRIKQLRKDAGLTQEALGKKLGVIKQTVSSWENNISEPNSEVLLSMASIFNVSIGYLYGDSSSDINYKTYHTDGSKYYLNEETAKTAQEIFENKELRMLFDAARDADPEDLKALHNMALALKRKERGNTDDTGC